jgi:hypothetical protein
MQKGSWFIVTNTNVLNNFKIHVGCAPRTHHLTGVIGGSRPTRW